MAKTEYKHNGCPAENPSWAGYDCHIELINLIIIPYYSILFPIQSFTFEAKLFGVLKTVPIHQYYIQLWDIF